MSTPNRVIWSEGLLMAPQHLQQQDRYVDDLVNARFGAFSRDFWGALSLSIDPRTLQQGTVTVESFEGVMPDGLPLDLEGASVGLPPPRPIDEHFPPTKAVLDLYLAVPQARDGISNIAVDRDPRVRFYRTARVTQDFLAEAEAQEVPFAQPSAVLLFGDESREGYDAIKIAEVIRADGGAFALSDTFIPPCLNIKTSAFLISGLRRLLSTMTTRRTALSGALSESEDGALEFTSRDVTRFLLLSAINTYYSVLDHYIETGDLAPRALYLSLVQLYGQLSVFSKDFDPESVPKFVYTDLRSTFEPLFAMLTALLHATVQEHYVAIGLEGRDDGMHFGHLEEDNIFHCSKYFIAVRSSLDEEEIRSKLPRLSKIASWQDINSITTAATPGAPIEVIYRPPSQIPYRAGTVYFAIDTDNQYWRNIMAERSIAVYLPEPFSPVETKMELMGVLDQKRRGRGAK